MENSNAFRACIHRGANQIGGTCVELAFDGQRILLDLGLPLDADEPSVELLPEVSGLSNPDPSLRAVVVSHGHGDHWGLLTQTGPQIPLAMGAATARILNSASAFVPGPFRPSVDFELSDRRTLQIGPFSITPYLVDHSAFDAYALIVEANGRRLFYSGDIRGHGRKAGLFDRLIAHPPKHVHSMLMEGSSLGRLKGDERFPSEVDIEQKMVESFSAAPGFVAVCASAQNIDRLVSIYRACKQTGRTLLLDAYAIEMLRATGSKHVPQADWPHVSVYIPKYQQIQIKRSGRFELIEQLKPYRIYRDELSKIGRKAVMLFRPAMMADVESASLWQNGRVIWSQWDGYLSAGAGEKLKTDLAARGVPLESIHTSGHASIHDLKRLADAINPGALIPIHTFSGDEFGQHFLNVVRRSDREWWSV